MKILVAFSGGKDSLACLIWTVNNPEYKNIPIEAVFCDTGWEHELTYKHIDDVTKKLNVKLVTLTSKKYKNFLELCIKKKMFPSAKSRFCTEELKSKPMIDYILKQKDNLIIIQGIRSEESMARSKMKEQCTFFKHYYEHYRINKKGRKLFHTYRKKEVLKFREKYNDDILRPVFDWSGSEIMNYIITNDFKPNPLYYKGMKRVGCYPCVMSTHLDLNAIIKNSPDHIQKLQEAEDTVQRSFFPPKTIPERYQTGFDENSKKKFPYLRDVVKYIKSKNENGDLFEENETDTDGHRCMSFYSICE